MKKIKIMLTSIALVALIGGALAFKAKFSGSYCTAPVNTGATTCPNTCPNPVTNSTTDGATQFVCTTTFTPNCTYDDGGVSKQITCNTSLQLKQE